MEMNENLAKQITKIAQKAVKLRDAGKAEGHEQSKQEAYAEVEHLNAELEQTLYGTDTGGKSQYDAFWDDYQDNGTKINYLGAFCGSGWKKETFRPKHSIGVDETQKYNGTYMFFHFCERDTAIDLVERCKELGITIDFSNFNYLTSAFSYAHISRFGIVDFKQITTTEGSYAWGSLFLGCPYLKTIDKLVFYKTNPDFQNAMFQNCTKLENITVEGVIAKNGLNLQWSTKLSKASIESIINCLSSETSGLSVTLSKNAKETSFTADEWATLIATRPNWAINLV